MLAHLVALGVENKAGGNHVLERHTVKHHRGYGVKREEPASRLVNALVDEVGGESQPLVNQFPVLKRIVYLSVGHGARVEPHVYQVCLAPHRLAALAHKHDVVNIRAVHVYPVVVLP